MTSPNKLDDLIELISEEMSLEPAQAAQFKELAAAWERSIGTMAEIEPDDDFRVNDAPLLPKLEGHEEEYDTLNQRAEKSVKAALRIYVSRRKNYLN